MFKLLSKYLNPSPEQMQEHKLAKARRELMEAEEAQEYWNAHTPMLRFRVARLSGEGPKTSGIHEVVGMSKFPKA